MLGEAKHLPLLVTLNEVKDLLLLPREVKDLLAALSCSEIPKLYAEFLYAI